MNLVLGAVKGLEMEHIAPFLFSLVGSGFRGKVVFFASGLSERTTRMLERMDVALITVDESTIFTSTPVNSLRYFIYEKYLAGVGDDIEKVMVADVRDIIFQRDPFTMEMDDALRCFVEDKGYTLATSVINAGWLAAAYGREALEALGHHFVSCSGFTIGPAPLMRDYVHAMTTGLGAAEERSPNITHVIGGVDQAVHNYLLYTGALPPAKISGNEDGPVLTLNYVDPETLRFNENEMVLNQAGEVVHVLHQYDRHPEFAQRLLKRIETDRNARRSAREQQAVQQQ